MSAGVKIGYDNKYNEYNASLVSDFLLRDLEQSLECHVLRRETARSNARMVRTALTRRGLGERQRDLDGPQVHLGTISSSRNRSCPACSTRSSVKQLIIRGAFHGTMLRNEIFNFARIGTFIERADNTARILDVEILRACCRRYPMSARRSTIFSGSPSCGRFPPIAPIAGSTMSSIAP